MFTILETLLTKTFIWLFKVSKVEKRYQIRDIIVTFHYVCLFALKLAASDITIMMSMGSDHYGVE